MQMKPLCCLAVGVEGDHATPPQQHEEHFSDKCI